MRGDATMAARRAKCGCILAIGTFASSWSRSNSLARTEVRRGSHMNLNGLLIGSENPKRLVEYYTTLFGKPNGDGGPPALAQPALSISATRSLTIFVTSP